MKTIREIYRDDIDFAALAAEDEEFAKSLKANGQLDFSNPEAVQQLTKALLKRDFKLTVTLPPDRLCPPVPNRLNYIFWLHDLLDTTNGKYVDKHDPERQVQGLDIGTGASAIYPLLACSLRSTWKMSGTDIDEKSFKFAQDNIQANELEDRITLLKTDVDDPLLPLDELKLSSIDFSMCNPPFYSSTHEMLVSAALKQRPPNTACTGAEVEMVTTGGEVAFVGRMIEESMVLGGRVQWYTSMLGKLSSVGEIVERLKEKKIGNYAVTEFVQGSRTKRWAVAWSLKDRRPPGIVARGIPTLQKTLLPFPPEFSFVISGYELKEKTVQTLNDTLATLPLKWTWDAEELSGLGFAARNVWSRASRRNRQRSTSTTDDPEMGNAEPAVGFRISLTELKGRQGGVIVLIRWVKGFDHVLFESFCGMLKRKLEA